MTTAAPSRVKSFLFLSTLATLQIVSSAVASEKYPNSIFRYPVSEEVRGASILYPIDLPTEFKFISFLVKARDQAQREVAVLMNNKSSGYSPNQAALIQEQTLAEFKEMQGLALNHSANLQDVQSLLRPWKIGHCQVYKNDYDRASGTLLIEIKNLEDNTYPGDRATVVLTSSKTGGSEVGFSASNLGSSRLELISQSRLYGKVKKSDFDSTKLYYGAALRITIDKKLEVTGLKVAKGVCTEIKDGDCKFYSQGFDCFTKDKVDGRQAEFWDSVVNSD